MGGAFVFSFGLAGVTIGQVITRPTEHPPQMPPEADKLLNRLTSMYSSARYAP